MQADVQRNINQQQRIEQGVKSGALTTREAGRLERGQARVDSAEARAGADGHVGRASSDGTEGGESPSRQIYREKHDAQQK